MYWYILLNLRSNAVGMGSTVSRIGGIMAPFLIGLHYYGAWIPNVVMGLVGFTGGLVAMTIRDTTGHPMMETIEEAERFHSGKQNKKCDQLRDAL